MCGNATSACQVTIEGDCVTLNISGLENKGPAVKPIVQVWAAPRVPSKTDPIGILLGEMQMLELAEKSTVEDVRLYLSPLDSVIGEFYIFVTVKPNADVVTIDDMYVLPEKYNFIHPRILEPVSLTFSEDAYALSVAGIENPREKGNVSGSLCLELWAFTTPFQGGAPSGIHLGGIENLKVIADKPMGPIENIFKPTLPVGKFYLALLLREWAGACYVTRDYLTYPKIMALPVKKTIILKIEADA